MHCLGVFRLLCSLVKLTGTSQLRSPVAAWLCCPNRLLQGQPLCFGLAVQHTQQDLQQHAGINAVSADLGHSRGQAARERG
jgi:hypothetical protein